MCVRRGLGGYRRLMADRTAHAEILQTNRALREWAAGLRAWSQLVRDGCVTGRPSHARPRRPASARPPVLPVRPNESGLPSLGEVRVTELFNTLVDIHGLPTQTAVQRLALGMAIAGYPPEADRISAADAFDVIERAVGER